MGKKNAALFLCVIFMLTIFCACNNVVTELPKESEYGSEELLPFGSYNLNTYLKPYWEGNIVYNETVLFLGKDDEAPLLYEIDEIIAISSYDLQIIYEENVDYIISDSKIKLTENTTIPFFTESEYYPETSQMSSLREDKVFLLYGERDTFTSRQIAVTYTHKGNWQGSIPQSQSIKYKKTISKLENKKDCSILFYGDSITTGANSSGKVGVMPNAETYPEMVVSYLKQKFEYDIINKLEAPQSSNDTAESTSKINYANTAVGGKGTNWAIEEVENRVIAYNPDLVIVAFGMNDKTWTASQFYSRMSVLIDEIRSSLPNAEIMLVSTSIPNVESAAAASGTPFYKAQDKFEAELVRIAEESDVIGVAKVTSLNLELLKYKRFRDMTANNINHPNDFLARAYSQVIIKNLGI